MRVLVLWADHTSSNLGLRALAGGVSELARVAWGDPMLVHHNWGARSTPVGVGTVKSAVRERVTGRGGLVPWLRTFDVVLDTRSGDSFTDIYGFERLAVMTAMASAVRRAGVPLVMMPQTIGPFGTRWGSLLGRYSTARASDIVTRDSVSLDVARRMGRADARLATDVVFALPQPRVGEQRDVVFNVSGLLWQGGPHVPAGDYRALVVESVRGLVDGGRTVTLVPHVLDSPSADNDVTVLPDVHRAIDRAEVEVRVPSSLEDVRGIVGGARVSVGSRMHLCLNSLSVGTPSVAIAYSRKFEPLLRDLGWRHTLDLSAGEDSVAGLLSSIGSAEAEWPSARVREVAIDRLSTVVSVLRKVA